MRIINALQTKAGAKTERKSPGMLNQPVQFLPGDQKDDSWAAWNIDWFEQQGIKQIKANARRFIKNIKLANGQIDKNDYIICKENDDTSDLLEYLTKEDETPLDIKFYPIIPNVINVLTGEFSKRVSKLMFRAVDDNSYNEMLEEKRQMLEDTLVKLVEQRVYAKLIDQGMDPEDPQVQQALNPENLKSLPEIEGFFKKDYRSLIEEWANHQKNIDQERFKMQEMEDRQFKTSLILNREYWHFRMMEDDYEIEIWDPVFTAGHKSRNKRYSSEGNWIMNLDLMTISDVIDNYGHLMGEDQIKRLESSFGIRGIGYNITGTPNDGSFYDGTQSYQANTNLPSLGYRQLASFKDNWMENQDIMNWIMKDSDDALDFANSELIRVTTVYWKTPRKLYHLTKIDENGEMIQDIVSENYKVTVKPLYDTTFYTMKTKDNLVYGEHLDAIYINEVWGGVRIGPNTSSSWQQHDDVEPIYLGINQAKPGRLPFQFKGDNSLYGCKLPVEGCDFGDLHAKSLGMVDSMKSFQIGFNLVNNQISDMLVDELGTVIMFDHNALPQNSMGESWGKGNLAKAYVAMKNFQMLPLDTRLQNTEGSMQFNQWGTVLDLSQTQRLIGRIELANYFKQAAYEVVGITPQRLGQVQASESATGTQAAQNNSYAQTEKYYTQHCDYLMPRVHQMRTDLAQYYHSKKPSVRLQYITTLDERVNFQMNGIDLLTRDVNVFCMTSVNTREILKQMKELAISNNTAGASIYDLGNVIKSESIAELDRVLKTAEEKQRAITQQQQQHEQEMEEMRLQRAEAEQQALREWQSNEAEKRDRKDIVVAEIRAAGYPDMSDNGEDEYLKRMDFIQKQSQYQDTMNFKREQEVNKNAIARQQIRQKDEELRTRREVANKQLEVARTNKNKYDKPTTAKKK